MKRAISYLRVSTKEQATRDLDPEGYSIPAQREACLRKAESIGVEVIDEYVDAGESARSTKRPQLQAMLARLKEKGDVEFVIVHKVDRLARSLADDVAIGLALKKAGAKLVSVTENIDDTPAGKFMHTIFAGMAEFYALNLATEAMKGLTQKAKSGGTPTRAPIGYLNVRKMIEGREIRTVEIDPERAPLVQLAFETYATGDFSLAQLLDILTGMGLTTRPTPQRPAKPLWLSNLADLLHNPYYIGTVRYNGFEYEGRHEPLVDKNLFERVQEVTRAHNVAGEKMREHNHYLKGTVFCFRCGSRLCLTNAKGKYLYFFCLNRQKTGKCDQPYVLAETIEYEVVKQYGIVQPDGKLVEEIRGLIGKLMKKYRTRAEKEVDRQKRRLSKLTDERTKLLHAHYAGAVPLDLLKSEQARIGRETDEALSRIGVCEMELDAIDRVLDDALKLAGDCKRAYEMADEKIRRQFNQAFFEKLLVEDDRVRGVVLAEPFAQLLADDLVRNLRRDLKNPDRVLSSGQGSSFNALVGGRGFEPLKSETLDLQSSPFGRFGILPWPGFPRTRGHILPCRHGQGFLVRHRFGGRPARGRQRAEPGAQGATAAVRFQGHRR